LSPAVRGHRRGGARLRARPRELALRARSWRAGAAQVGADAAIAAIAWLVERSAAAVAFCARPVRIWKRADSSSGSLLRFLPSRFCVDCSGLLIVSQQPVVLPVADRERGDEDCRCRR
jgi:hypothetical protein